MSQLTVAVLGTGIMGSAMARNIAGAGHAVRAWNRTISLDQALADDGIEVARTATAAFEGADVDRLLADTGIIRHRGKIEATIANARAAVALRDQRGPGTTLADLVWSYRPERTPMPATAAEVPTTSNESIALAKDLKRRGFRFVGPTTMFALMEALGIVDTHLLGSHRRGSSGLWTADGAPAAPGNTPS